MLTKEQKWLRFQKLVKVDQGCWIWIGRVSKTGIPRFYWEPGNSEATQYIWERTNGPKPAGHSLSRICRNKLCVAPHHLACRPKQKPRQKKGGTP